MSVRAQVILSAVVGGIPMQVSWVPRAGDRRGGHGPAVRGRPWGPYTALKIPTMVISLGMLMLFEVIAQALTKGSGYVRWRGEISSMGTPPYNFVIAGIVGVLFYIISTRRNSATAYPCAWVHRLMWRSTRSQQ